MSVKVVAQDPSLKPDNTLPIPQPGQPPVIDNTLPGSDLGWGDPRPDNTLPTDPHPEHPIVYPPEGEIPPPIEPPTGVPPNWDIVTAWTPVTGWIVVAIPTGNVPTPSRRK
jgi:hypothetical protein